MHRASPLIASLFILFAAPFATAQETQPRPPQINIAGDVMRVPVEMPQGAPVLEVMINGKGPYKLLLDTGVSLPLLISQRVAEEAGLSVVGSRSISDPSGRNPFQVSTYAPMDVQIGDMTFRSVPGVEYGGPGVDGVIGAGLFDQLRVTLDFVRSEVAFDRLSLPVADGRTVHDFRLDGGVATVDFKVGDVVIPTHIDIGQTVTQFIMPEAVALSLPHKGAPRLLATARTASGTMEVMAIDMVEPVMLNQQRFDFDVAAYPSVIPLANIGSKGFAGRVVVFDYPNKRLQITNIETARDGQ